MLKTGPLTIPSKVEGLHRNVQKYSTFLDTDFADFNSHKKAQKTSAFAKASDFVPIHYIGTTPDESEDRSPSLRRINTGSG